MRYRRLCPGCWADWIDVDDALCIMCTEERLRKRPKGSRKSNPLPVDWYGPDETDLMNADLETPSRLKPTRSSLPWGFHEPDDQP